MKMNLLLIFLSLGHSIEAKINPTGPTVISDFANCISELIELNFNKSGLLLFANMNNVSTSVARIHTELLKHININVKHAVQVQTSRQEGSAICREDSPDDENLSIVHKDPYDARPVAHYAIILIDNYKDFTKVASKIVHSRIWNPHAKFIILLFNFSSDKANALLVENILTCLFRNNVINIVVIVPKESDIRNAIIYSWRPFDPPKYCGYFNETAKNRLLVINSCERGALKYQKDDFKDRIPDNMGGCVLQILALERQPFVSGDRDDPNIEKLYFKRLTDEYNFKTEYTLVNGFRGERNEGVWDGALKELAAKKGQILMGGIFPDFDVHEDFECSKTYLADAYTWVAPRAFQSPKWTALFIIFQNTVWQCVIAAYFICVLSWIFLGHFSKETLYHKTLRHCIMNTWISHVGFCAYARPVKLSLRVFYVFFNIYCILFLTCYQTKLIDVLTNPKFEEQIDTIEELVESGLKFGGSEELHGLFYNSSDSFDYMIGEKWVDVDNMSKALMDVTVYRNFSVLCSRLELAHFSSVLSELSDSSGNFRYFAFERDMFTVSLEMVALKGFAFMQGFSNTLEIFKQLGVNSEVRRYFAQLNSRKRAKLLLTLAADQPDGNPLSLGHLQGGFLALTLGVISGTVALFIEIIVNTKYFKRKVNCRKRMKSC
ncbi:uncharacterized protein LOC126369625 [Pectinophora gossypiella]|uniref:uncharacterized protein LOC126369625 n=1 Tax=Pectinophora gossypiella TaxID=13191 RepID=UPI00214E9EA9|nr:uncharacterized protein LOC126369625 [Pectinophora gossypiella]